MSHYGVMVIVPGDEDVEKTVERLLKPFDENTEVEPYRRYHDGSPNSYWAVDALRRAGELPEGPVTWEQVVAAHNAAYVDGEADPAERLHLDTDGDAGTLAYEMTTYNPQSKWDWWVIGGRQKHRLRVLAGAALDDLVDPELDDRVDYRFPAHIGWATGARRKALDLDGIRAQAATTAGERYAKFERITMGLPAAQGWSHYVDLEKRGELTWDEAREQYRAQPAIAAAREVRDFAWDCPVDEFAGGLEAYVNTAVDNALPGYALLKPDGTWHASGEMGWFGAGSHTDSSTATFKHMLNEYVEALHPETWVVMVDCHI